MNKLMFLKEAFFVFASDLLIKISGDILLQRRIFYGVVNGLFSLMLLMGAIGGSEGAENVAIFIAWASFIVSFICLSDEFQALLSASGGIVVPAWFHVTLHGILLIVMVWNGWFTTSIAALLALLMQCRTYYEQHKFSQDKVEPEETNASIPSDQDLKTEANG